MQEDTFLLSVLAKFPNVERRKCDSQQLLLLTFLS